MYFDPELALYVPLPSAEEPLALLGSTDLPSPGLRVHFPFRHEHDGHAPWAHDARLTDSCGQAFAEEGQSREAGGQSREAGGEKGAEWLSRSLALVSF